jgi:hypothetical protein
VCFLPESLPPPDLDHYDIFTARHPDAEAELESMTAVATHTPTTHEGGKSITDLASALLNSLCRDTIDSSVLLDGESDAVARALAEIEDLSDDEAKKSIERG